MIFVINSPESLGARGHTSILNSNFKKSAFGIRFYLSQNFSGQKEGGFGPLNLLAELEVGPSDEPELLQRHTDALQHCLNDPLIILSTQFQKFPRSLHVV